MAGLFDGMRVSKTGIQLHSLLQEVIGQNVANASNKNYSRQDVQIDASATIYDGKHFRGQGADAKQIIRIRDGLLDGQIRAASAESAYYETEVTWLQKIELAFNEPSDSGLSTNLAQFFDAFHELSQNSEILAVRQNVLNETKQLSNVLRQTANLLNSFRADLDHELRQTAEEFNTLSHGIAQLNFEIFNLEAGTEQQANNLRDARDGLLDQLSQLVGISVLEDQNGMVDVSINSQPVVSGASAQELLISRNQYDMKEMEVMWKRGDHFYDTSSKMGALLYVRDTTLPKYLDALNTLSSDLIEGVNSVYANGVSLEPHDLLISNRGFEALGVSDGLSPLNLVDAGQTGSIKVCFYNGQNQVVRSAGIVVQPQDSLQEIMNKLNAIPGFNASILANDPDHPGRVILGFDPNSPSNLLGEVGFHLSNNQGSFDTSGFLHLVGFDQTDKSSNTSAAAPLLESSDLTALQTTLGVTNIASVLSKSLNLQGKFYLNSFETATEDPTFTNGHLLQQLSVDVLPSDSINTIMAKVNTLTADYGLSMTYNAVSKKLEITSSEMTDATGNLAAAGTNHVRLGFSNSYRYPESANDTPPAGYNGLSDNTGFFAALQLNTLFSGTNALDIDLDSKLTRPERLNCGSLSGFGNSQIALAITALENLKIADEGQFSLSDSLGNLLAKIGSELRHEDQLSRNQELLKEGFLNERDSISGVSLDEELAKMIQYQRAYEANAKMYAVFSEMIEYLLSKTR
ncbi:MAG: flagellar hook-associated protein FlgK [Chlamydiales bacterium]|jgi:flagellar hook-associated protein 1 FlgK|nr:flagellar hook-associated protein FlgK [Chlamydiales bacterium]